MKTTNIPHILTAADDGHFYLIPESKLARFEELIGLIPGTESDADYDKLMAKLAAYDQYRIGEDIESLRIYQWEERG